MRKLVFVVLCGAWLVLSGSAACRADVVVRPQWTTEQVGGDVQTFYYWHGQKYHVDSAGKHWLILPNMCVPCNNTFVAGGGGPLCQTLACLHGRLVNLADRMTGQ